MELLSRSPLTRSQLMHLPWAGGLVGVINSLGFWKYLSPSSVVLLAACLGGLMLVLAAWLAYRSEFATRYGLVAAVLMWLLFGPMTTSIAVLMLILLSVQDDTNHGMLRVISDDWSELWRDLDG